MLRKPFIEGEHTAWSIIDESTSRTEAKRLAVLRRDDNSTGDLILVTCIDNVTRIEETADYNLWVVRKSGNVVKADNVISNWLMMWNESSAGALIEASKYVKKERIISVVAELMDIDVIYGKQGTAAKLAYAKYMANELSRDAAVRELHMIHTTHNGGDSQDAAILNAGLYLMTGEKANLLPSFMPFVYSKNKDVHERIKIMIKEKIPLPVVLLSRIGPGQDLL